MTPSENKSNDEFFESLIAPKGKKISSGVKIASGVKITSEENIMPKQKITPKDNISNKENINPENKIVSEKKITSAEKIKSPKEKSTNFQQNESSPKDNLEEKFFESLINGKKKNPLPAEIKNTIQGKNNNKNGIQPANSKDAKKNNIKPSTVDQKNKSKISTVAQKKKPASQDEPIPVKKAPKKKKSKSVSKREQSLIQHAVFNQFSEDLSFIQNLNSQTMMGLDIDTDKLRYVVVKRSGGLIQAKEWGSQLFPTDESDRFKALQIALENMKAKAYRANMQVYASIFSPDINIRQIIIPKVEKKTDLDKAIFFRNKSDLPNFDEKAVWTYKILNEFEEEEITKLRIMCIVVPGNLVERYMFLFRHLKIDVKNLVPRPAAVHAAYVKMIRYPQRDLVIDISYDFTQICFMRYGSLEYVRNLGIGSHNLENSIHEEKKVPIKDDDLELPEAEDKSEDSPLQDKMKQRLLTKIKDLKSKQNPVLHTFFSEILRSLTHLQKKGSNEFIERIFITGYGIKKESLLPYLRTRLHIPVLVLSPSFLEGVSTVDYGDFFTAFGAITQEDKSYSLLPKHFKTQFLFSRLNMLYSVTIVLSLIGLTYLTVIKERTISSKKNLVALYQQQYDAINPAEKKYKDTFSKINKIQSEKLGLLKVVSSPRPITELMRVFSNETPKEVRLHRIEFSEIKTLGNKGKVNAKPSPDGLKFQSVIVGSITSNNILADVILVNYINHLRDLGYFKSINLIHTGKDEASGRTEFQLELLY